MHPSKSVGVDNVWLMFNGFLSEFIKIPARPAWLSRGFPCTYFYVREYVEIRIAEVGGFVENQRFRDHRM
jgi:hypothetical protein